MDMELEHGGAEDEDDRGSYSSSSSSSSKRSFGASSDATVSSTPSKLQALRFAEDLSLFVIIVSKLISAKAAVVQPPESEAREQRTAIAVTGYAFFVWFKFFCYSIKLAPLFDQYWIRHWCNRSRVVSPNHRWCCDDLHGC
jgi:hypothetical protein